MHVYLIGPYIKSIGKHHMGGATTKSGVSLTCMIMIDPKTVWFDILKVLTFHLDEVMGGND